MGRDVLIFIPRSHHPAWRLAVTSVLLWQGQGSSPGQTLGASSSRSVCRGLAAYIEMFFSFMFVAILVRLSDLKHIKLSLFQQVRSIDGKSLGTFSTSDDHVTYLHCANMQVRPECRKPSLCGAYT